MSKPVNTYTAVRKRTSTVFYTIHATSRAEAMRKLRLGQYTDQRSTPPTLSVGSIMP